MQCIVALTAMYSSIDQSKCIFNHHCRSVVLGAPTKNLFNIQYFIFFSNYCSFCHTLRNYFMLLQPRNIKRNVPEKALWKWLHHLRTSAVDIWWFISFKVMTCCHLQVFGWLKKRHIDLELLCVQYCCFKATIKIKILVLIIEKLYLKVPVTLQRRIYCIVNFLNVQMTFLMMSYSKNVRINRNYFIQYQAYLQYQAILQSNCVLIYRRLIYCHRHKRLMTA